MFPRGIIRVTQALPNGPCIDLFILLNNSRDVPASAHPASSTRESVHSPPLGVSWVRDENYKVFPTILVLFMDMPVLRQRDWILLELDRAMI